MRYINLTFNTANGHFFCILRQFADEGLNLSSAELTILACQVCGQQFQMHYDFCQLIRVY